MKKIIFAIMLLFATNVTTMFADDVILHPTNNGNGAMVKTS